MYRFYSLLLTAGFLALLPRFLIDAFRHGKYTAGFRERLGFLTQITAKRPVIWLHCVSVGETQAARPLAELILQQLPEHSLVVSTITLTGQNLARQLFKDKAVGVFYFPFDWNWTARRSLKKIRPAAVLLMETELWPNFLRQCRLQHIPVALVNGRLSHRSTRRYKRLKSFFRRVVTNLDLAIMQTPADGQRIKSLGLPDAKLFVSGNLKFDAGVTVASEAVTQELRDRFKIQNDTDLILAASTHAPEERVLIESFQLLKRGTAAPRMMIAPRHPERFDEVAAILNDSGLSWKRRTGAQTEADRSCDVILLDTIGELTAAFPLATVVFVGGSIPNFGGHNVLEPAAVGKCIITGPNTQNFEAIIKSFVDAEAIIQLPNTSERDVVSELTRTFENMLGNQQLRTELGERAALLIKQNSGAAQSTLEIIKRHLIA